MSVPRLQALLKREAREAAREVQRAMVALAHFHARRLTGEGVLEKKDAQLLALARAISRLKAAGDLSGRVEVQFPLAKKRILEPEQFATRDELPDVVPWIPFVEAIEDLKERDPVGALELERAGLEVEAVYGSVEQPDGTLYYPHGFTAARAVDEDMAARVKERLVQGLAKGHATPKIVQGLVDTWDWPQSYAATVVRTTINTATTAGRFREGERVATSGIPVGLMVLCVDDADVRRGRPQDHGENHLAMQGFVAQVGDPVWRTHSPPYSWNCRCTLSPVVGEDVPQGFVRPPAAAAFAPGFGRRPDLRS